MAERERKRVKEKTDPINYRIAHVTKSVTENRPVLMGRLVFVNLWTVYFE